MLPAQSLRARDVEPLFHALPDPALFTGLDRRVEHVNQAFLDLFGLTAAEVLGEPPRSIYPDDEAFLAAAVHWRALSAEQPIARFETVLQRAGGERFRAVVTGRLVIDEHGREAGYVGVVRDVEEERRAAERLAELARAMEEEGRRKDAFIAMLSHELRSPLSAILPAIELLQSSPGRSPADARHLDLVHRQTSKLRRLIDDLLDLSRINQGKVLLQREVCDLAVLVPRAVETVAPFIEERGHTLRLEAPAGLWVDGDPLRLEQVIGNLVHNAAKYSEPGGWIAVEARRDGDRVAVSVRDGGIGIPASELDRVFQPFAQREASLDRAQGGLGVGLALVRSLVVLHGGAVSAHSDGPGKGSRFEVSLPAAEAPARDAATPDPSSPQPQRGGGLRVLVVDDNHDAAEMVAEVLTMFGCQVSIAHDGERAIAAAAADAPELAIVDIELPGIDGYQVARRLRTLTPATELVALSGHGRDSDRAEAQAAGFSAHLTKPVGLASLRELVARSRA